MAEDNRDAVMDRLRAEVDLMTGPEAEALEAEISEVLGRKLADDTYAGSHAVALGATTSVLVRLLRAMTRNNPGARHRLNAAVIGMIKADVTARLDEPVVKT